MGFAGNERFIEDQLEAIPQGRVLSLEQKNNQISEQETDDLLPGTEDGALAEWDEATQEDVGAIILDEEASDEWHNLTPLDELLALVPVTHRFDGQNQDALDLYFQEMRQQTLLTADEEVQLAKAIEAGRAAAYSIQKARFPTHLPPTIQEAMSKIGRAHV